MISYKDMTFCSFHEDCKDAETCHRALTDEVRKRAVAWWGSEDAPICEFATVPDCHTVQNDTSCE